MSKIILMIFTLLISCKSPSQDGKITSDDLTELKNSFVKKEEETFLKNFPQNFSTFKNTFGWNDEKDSANPLYKQANNYIDYWFLLINKPEFENYDFKIIAISKGGYWEADAVNYFKDKSLSYIKSNKKYDLINSLKKEDAQSVLTFFFDSSHQNYDTSFVSNLNKEKQEIVRKIFSTNISNEKNRSTFKNYENNNAYFIRTFDVNKDGILDRIVSNKAYQGENLFVFYGNKQKKYVLALETTNFSEDGGNIIQDITPIANRRGLKIITSFPDRGYYEKEYNIIPEKNTWILKNIIYKTMSDNSKDAVKYICDINQNIDITKSGWTELIKPIPEENERNKECRTENENDTKTTFIIQDPDGFTNLRNEKNSSSEILQKINSRESIEVLDKAGDWFLVLKNIRMKLDYLLILLK